MKEHKKVNHEDKDRQEKHHLIEKPVQQVHDKGVMQQVSTVLDMPSDSSLTEIDKMEAEIKRLNECLDQKTKECQANNDRFLRSCADLENYKKRLEKEKGDWLKYSNENIIREILPVVDNLERAIDHIEDESSFTAVKDGIKLVLDNLLAVLKKFGIESDTAMGEIFDPNKHEAVGHEEILDSKPGTVIKEFHKGYYLNGRLLRPAMVVISKHPETNKEVEADSSACE